MKVAAEADRQRREGVDVVDFSAGEPDFPTPDNIKNAAIEALHQNFTKYTPVSGTVELKQTICDYHKRTYGTAYSPKECIATIGGKHAIFNLVQALIDPGDEVIIPVPYWVTYKDVVNFAAGKCVFVDTDEQEGFVLSAAQVERHLTPKTRMIILNSPCNPSGAVLRAGGDGEDFPDRQGSRHLDHDRRVLRAVPLRQRAVLAGVAAGRQGNGGGGRIALEDLRDDRLAHGVRAGSGGGGRRESTSCKATRRRIRLRSRRKRRSKRCAGRRNRCGIMLAEYRRRRDYVIGRLRKIPGVKAQEPRGAFYAYPNVSAAFRNGISNSLEFSEKLLAEEHVAVVPGEAFGTAEHIRMSYATSMKELERGLDRIERFIKARV